MRLHRRTNTKLMYDGGETIGDQQKVVRTGAKDNLLAALPRERSVTEANDKMITQSMKK